MTLNEALLVITLNPNFEEFTISRVYSAKIGYARYFRANIYNDEEFCGEGELAEEAIIKLAKIIKNDK